MSKITLLGISSVARAGKDTLYLILEKILKENNIITDRAALADHLKLEISDFTKSQYNINIFTKDDKEKEIVRPIMLAHGKIKRFLSNGKHYTNILNNRLKDNIKDNILTIITDIRYTTYSEDEISWLKSNGGLLIHVERISPDGQPVNPANSDESENDPKIKSIADYFLKWPTTNNLDIREDCARIQLHNLIERIKNEYK